MKKQVVFALVFLILALGISGLVYRGAKRRDMDRRHRLAIQPNPFPQPPAGRRAVPGQPLPPASPTPSSLEDVQRVRRTLDEIQRINRMNQDLQRRTEEKRRPPETQKP